VRAGAEITVNLDNALPAAAGNVSIVFPGHQVTSTTGSPGALTQEAQPGGRVTYTFTASEPGTYQYHSGTRPDLQVQMGLYGALIVRPADWDGNFPTDAGLRKAYNHAGSQYRREHLFLLSEIDLDIHQSAELQAAGPGPIEIGPGPHSPEYWLINGRAAPDTLAASGTDVLTYQPYNSSPAMLPGERLLLRVVGAGQQMHPLHTHGNHVQVLARDGRMLVSETDDSKLAGPVIFTIPSAPGGTMDAIFEWTGKDLGWDMYGHVAGPGGGGACNDFVDNTTGLATDVSHEYYPGDGYDDGGANKWEWCADHRKPIPVDLPGLSSLAFGGFYSGSPYLGALGSLPPGEGGLNPNGGFTYMWHSHNEVELVNNDVFPGGMLTILVINPPNVPIPGI
jgi:FtsP/CotA-like multicopper oxidase with cupredoxin domain